MSGPNFGTRRAKLARRLKSSSIDALLVSGLSNVRYLTGFTGDSTWLLLTPSHTILISDTRYETQLAEECAGVDAVIRDAGQTTNDVVHELLTKVRLRRVGIEGEHLTLSQYSTLKEKLTAAELISTSGLVEELRVIKDRWELDQIREAVRIAERGFQVIRSQLRPDLTERQIRYSLEAAMRDFGAVGPAFEPIVGVGPNGALPHAHAGERRVAESPALLIDWGAQTFSGYRSDLTRVLFTSKPTKQMEQVYQLVLSAQQAAIAAIRPGGSSREVDGIARGMIADAGFGRFFGHGLGHGFGLDIHEAIRMSPVTDCVFRPGMVITVEPGVYLPGRFGVRLEQDVLVTPDGNEVLTSVPIDFEDAIVGFLA